MLVTDGGAGNRCRVSGVKITIPRHVWRSLASPAKPLGGRFNMWTRSVEAASDEMAKTSVGAWSQLLEASDDLAVIMVHLDILSLNIAAMAI